MRRRSPLFITIHPVDSPSSHPASEEGEDGFPQQYRPYDDIRNPLGEEKRYGSFKDGKKDHDHKTDNDPDDHASEGVKKDGCLAQFSAFVHTLIPRFLVRLDGLIE
jgi:hypothetical protein